MDEAILAQLKYLVSVNESQNKLCSGASAHTSSVGPQPNPQLRGHSTVVQQRIASTPDFCRDGEHADRQLHFFKSSRRPGQLSSLNTSHWSSGQHSLCRAAEHSSLKEDSQVPLYSSVFLQQHHGQQQPLHPVVQSQVELLAANWARLQQPQVVPMPGIPFEALGAAQHTGTDALELLLRVIGQQDDGAHAWGAAGEPLNDGHTHWRGLDSAHPNPGAAPPQCHSMPSVAAGSSNLCPGVAYHPQHSWPAMQLSPAQPRWGQTHYPGASFYHPLQPPLQTASMPASYQLDPAHALLPKQRVQRAANLGALHSMADALFGRDAGHGGAQQAQHGAVQHSDHSQLYSCASARSSLWTCQQKHQQHQHQLQAEEDRSPSRPLHSLPPSLPPQLLSALQGLQQLGHASSRADRRSDQPHEMASGPGAGTTGVVGDACWRGLAGVGQCVPLGLSHPSLTTSTHDWMDATRDGAALPAPFAEHREQQLRGQKGGEGLAAADSSAADCTLEPAVPDITALKLSPELRQELQPLMERRRQTMASAFEAAGLTPPLTTDHQVHPALDEAQEDEGDAVQAPAGHSELEGCGGSDSSRLLPASLSPPPSSHTTLPRGDAPELGAASEVRLPPAPATSSGVKPPATGREIRGSPFLMSAVPSLTQPLHPSHPSALPVDQLLPTRGSSTAKKEGAAGGGAAGPVAAGGAAAADDPMGRCSLVPGEVQGEGGVALGEKPARRTQPAATGTSDRTTDPQSPPCAAGAPSLVAAPAQELGSVSPPPYSTASPAPSADGGSGAAGTLPLLPALPGGVGGQAGLGRGLQQTVAAARASRAHALAAFFGRPGAVSQGRMARWEGEGTSGGSGGSNAVHALRPGASQEGHTHPQGAARPTPPRAISVLAGGGCSAQLEGSAWAAGGGAGMPANGVGTAPEHQGPNHLVGREGERLKPRGGAGSPQHGRLTHAPSPVAAVRGGTLHPVLTALSARLGVHAPPPDLPLQPPHPVNGETVGCVPPAHLGQHGRSSSWGGGPSAGGGWADTRGSVVARGWPTVRPPAGGLAPSGQLPSGMQRLQEQLQGVAGGGPPGVAPHSLSVAPQLPLVQQVGGAGGRAGSEGVAARLQALPAHSPSLPLLFDVKLHQQQQQGGECHRFGGGTVRCGGGQGGDQGEVAAGAPLHPLPLRAAAARADKGALSSRGTGLGQSLAAAGGGCGAPGGHLEGRSAIAQQLPSAATQATAALAAAAELLLSIHGSQRLQGRVQGKAGAGAVEMKGTGGPLEGGSVLPGGRQGGSRAGSPSHLQCPQTSRPASLPAAKRARSAHVGRDGLSNTVHPAGRIYVSDRTTLRAGGAALAVEGEAGAGRGEGC